MNKLWMLAAVALSTGAAIAQTSTTVTTTGVVMQACPPVAVSTACPTPTVSTDFATTPAYPEPCAAKAMRDIDNKPVLLVLGSEERYALDSLRFRGSDLNWNDVSYTPNSIFSPDNPLLNSRPNPVISRHGNPYYPYYVANADLRRVAGYQECSLSFPSNVTAEQRTTLINVQRRFSGMTTQQAMAMGYQPLGACIQDVGQMYVNQAAIDNCIDPMMPEAFSFDQKGKIVAVHYIVLANTPVMAFNQPMQPSPIVQGAYQLPVWLYRCNSNGLFTMQNPNNKDLCPASPGVGY